MWRCCSCWIAILVVFWSFWSCRSLLWLWRPTVQVIHEIVYHHANRLIDCHLFGWWESERESLLKIDYSCVFSYRWQWSRFVRRSAAEINATIYSAPDPAMISGPLDDADGRPTGTRLYKFFPFFFASRNLSSSSSTLTQSNSWLNCYRGGGGEGSYLFGLIFFFHSYFLFFITPHNWVTRVTHTSKYRPFMCSRRYWGGKRDQYLNDTRTMSFSLYVLLVIHILTHTILTVGRYYMNNGRIYNQWQRKIGSYDILHYIGHFDSATFFSFCLQYMPVEEIGSGGHRVMGKISISLL